jgi:hypothetical protein
VVLKKGSGRYNYNQRIKTGLKMSGMDGLPPANRSQSGGERSKGMGELAEGDQIKSSKENQNEKGEWKGESASKQQPTRKRWEKDLQKCH